MTQDTNVELLNSIYQNAKMGAEAICAIKVKTENPQLKADLVTQEKEYRNLQADAYNKMKAMGQIPQEPTGISKIGLHASVCMNTAMNSETSHIAELMIKGSNAGILTMTKALNSCTQASDEARGLAERLVQSEQQNIDRLKIFLQ